MTDQGGPASGDGALLCERCGYPLDHLTSASACPECGRPIEESLPRRRVGSAWQRGPGAGSWVATNWHALRHPRATFGVVAMERGRSMGLLRLNLLASAVILAAGWCVHLIRMDLFMAVFPPTWWRVPVSAAMVAMGIGVPAAYAALWVLTWIETRGIRFIGGRRGWRVSGGVAWAVCAHASVGWIVASALATVGLGAVWALDIQPTSMINATTFTYDPLRPWRAPVGGFLAGLVLFEVLVNVGIRRCRYANGPSAAPGTTEGGASGA